MIILINIFIDQNYFLAFLTYFPFFYLLSNFLLRFPNHPTHLLPSFTLYQKLHLLHLSLTYVVQCSIIE